MNWSKLRQLVHQHFSLEELFTLCFDLQIEVENLPRNRKDVFVRELIIHIQRLHRLEEFLAALKESRPHIDWLSVMEVPPKPQYADDNVALADSPSSSISSAGPITSNDGSNWYATLAHKGWSKRIINLKLAHESYQIEFVNHMFDLENSVEQVIVNGTVVCEGGSAIEWETKFEFELDDGDQRYQAVIELEPNKLWANIKKFRLTVNGRIMYSEGRW
ncbi:MAG: hypothetical protein R6X32_13225 [Chloroflexota bacterium]